eukprot:m.40810 g.40810  ORF g.40810 m.40810 type:complete len:100 (-) comp6018_c1_seq1:65-364(-)
MDLFFLVPPPYLPPPSPSPLLPVPKKKTAEELDNEMFKYFAKTPEGREKVKGEKKDALDNDLEAYFAAAPGDDEAMAGDEAGEAPAEAAAAGEAEAASA